MGRLLLVDADVLVYESAFAAQTTLYCYGDREFPDAAQAKTFCELNELDYRALRKDGSITSRVEVLPESAARMILAQKLASIQESCQSTDYRLLLSGDGNYRDEVAVTKKYKANRENQPKPQHYAFVRSCILDNKRTEMTVGVEADDALGMYMTENPEAVICSIDKDLMQLPGRHYNWGKGIKFKITLADGLYWFHHQLITGDATDNIPGIPSRGDKAADTWLEGTRLHPFMGFQIVQAEYREGPFKFKDGTYTPDDTEAYLNEQGRLLWMMRKPGEVWTADYYEGAYLS